MREIKAQTHSGVKLELFPTWKDGKVWEYKSTNTADPLQVSEVSKVQGLVPTSSVLTLSPKERHHTFKQNGNKVQENGCRICNKTATKSMWISCGHKNTLTGRKDWSDCIYQWCVGLYYKTADNLAKVPFFCPEHVKKKQTKINKVK